MARIILTSLRVSSRLSSSRLPIARPALFAALFVYLMFARTRASADTFLMLTDQMRDWRYALGPLTGLPLTGTQSTAGGWSLGPVYYWVLWLSRGVVGPWIGNLPHAGAICISLTQSGADTLLIRSG